MDGTSPKKGLLWPGCWLPEEWDLLTKLVLEAISALVKAILRVVGESSSRIWEFSATAWSNLLQRSLILEDCALIFLSFLIWDFDGSGASSSSPDSTSTDLVDTGLTLVFKIAHWWVPRTLANSLWNSVNEHFYICTSKVFMIDVLLWS